MLALAAMTVATVCQIPQTEPILAVDLCPAKDISLADPAARRRSWDELHAFFALQGIVNRKGPRLYAYFVGDDGATDRVWPAWLQSKGEWLEGRSVKVLKGFDDALLTLKDHVRGVVVWDERVPATSALASTLAGIEDALPVRYDPTKGSLYRRLALDAGGAQLKVVRRLIKTDGSPMFTGKGTIPGTKLPSTGSAKCDAMMWGIENLVKTGKTSSRRPAYYPNAQWLIDPKDIPVERTLLSNHDYFISERAFFFDLGPWDDDLPNDDLSRPVGTDFKTLTALLHAMYARSNGIPIHVGGFTPWDQKYTDFTGRKHGGVPTEWRFAEILSCFNAYMDADAPGLHAMADASFFRHFPLEQRYHQTNRPSEVGLRAKGLLGADGKVLPKHFVAIYVGDYDSAAWLYEMPHQVWDDPARGSIPLSWAFNPTLEDRFPVGLAYARKTATANDSFITGDSGVGYLSPTYLDGARPWSGLPSGLAAWEQFSKPYLDRWDLRVTGFVIDGNAPPMVPAVSAVYARLTPRGVVAQNCPPQSLVNGVPFLRMSGDLDAADISADVSRIISETPKDGPSFRIYRTILWPASRHKELFDRASAQRPDIVFLDAPTLLALLGKHLRG